MAKYRTALQDVSAVGLAISDPNRLRILAALASGSLCVCQMTALLELAASTVSKHLSILKQAGLVQEKKIGRWVWHDLCTCDCPCRPVIGWVLLQLKDDPTTRQDRKRLTVIRKMDVKQLCGS